MQLRLSIKQSQSPNGFEKLNVDDIQDLLYVNLKELAEQQVSNSDCKEETSETISLNDSHCKMTLNWF